MLIMILIVTMISVDTMLLVNGSVGIVGSELPLLLKLNLSTVYNVGVMAAHVSNAAFVNNFLLVLETVHEELNHTEYRQNKK